MIIKKNIRFTLLTIFLLVFFTESLSFLYLKIFSIDSELFLVENYAERTSEKTITLKKNFYKEIKINDWSVITSPIRTRISSLKERERYNNFKNNYEEKFIFIGDSIPFGYGLNADESLPHVFEKENNFFVINGAIPSFSLSQSIERFKNEFANIKNIKYVYLQAIDPVNQYINKGSAWIESDNWTNSKINKLKKTNFMNLNIPVYGEPFSYVIFKEFRTSQINTLKKERTIMSDDRFKKHVKNKINEIYKITNDIGATLILTTGSRNPNSKDTKKMKVEQSTVDNMIVLILKNFSEKKNNVIYFDNISVFKDVSNEYFIDSCCHYSKKGAKLISQELSKIVN